jgi:regulator of cell morphogenesis and NO signaling
MTVIDTDLTLGTLVTEHPTLARELERLGLDYCCRGRRSLEDACRDQGLDPATVAAALGEAAATDAGPDDWATMGPAELVDHLEATHHAYLWRELPRIEALADKVTTVHGAHHPELVAVRDAVRELRTELEPHLAKEERVLFPFIRRLAADGVAAPAPGGGSVRNPIAVMLREHDRAGDLLDRLRALTGGYVPPADGCASYREYYRTLAEVEADTHLHVHKENNLLFPAVVALETQALETQALETQAASTSSGT